MPAASSPSGASYGSAWEPGHQPERERSEDAISRMTSSGLSGVRGPSRRVTTGWPLRRYQMPEVGL